MNIETQRKQYEPSDNGGGPCVHCGEWIGMHYQTAKGELFCVPIVPMDFGIRPQS